MNLEDLNHVFTQFKNPQLYGRYITNSDIEKCLGNLKKPEISTLGFSVEDRPIYGLKLGRGPIKILMWSQMHGNESTSTKALFDCFNLLETENRITTSVLEHCTLMVIPILNPDGAQHYTRVNANTIDLNRDAQNLSQPESIILNRLYTEFKPDYCFNLHGQRTIFSAGATNNVATLSFLSPAQDAERTITTNRKAAMVIISEINQLLQSEIPNGIGRYDDGFNINCVGDTFQNFGVPTLLYEAGHYKDDYDREEVRRFMFISLLKGLDVIIKGVDYNKYSGYFNIPENAKCFYDVIIRNAKCDDLEQVVDIAIQYREVLIANKLEFIPVIEDLSKLNNKYGHKEIEANGFLVKTVENSRLIIGSEIDFVMINNERISLKP